MFNIYHGRSTKKSFSSDDTSFSINVHIVLKCTINWASTRENLPSGVCEQQIIFIRFNTMNLGYFIVHIKRVLHGPITKEYLANIVGTDEMPHYCKPPNFCSIKIRRF